MANFKMDENYNDVPSRFVEMRLRFPELSVQQVKMEFVEVAGKSWVVYTAAAFRYPDDPAPGMGTAWEPIPGPTPYTKDSEVQNAETSAWGRALIAIGASTKRGIASVEEIRNRTGVENAKPIYYDLGVALGHSFSSPAQRKAFVEETLGRPVTGGIESLAAIDVEEVEIALRARTTPSENKVMQEAQEFVDRMAK